MDRVEKERRVTMSTRVPFCMHECDCSCHKKNSYAVHIVPCCEKCPRCHKGISRGHLVFHLKDCHSHKGAKK